MPLTFNTILLAHGIDPRTVRLLGHSDTREDTQRPPYELWRQERALFEHYQAHQDFGQRKKLQAAPLWASFIATAAGETMFVGLYEARYQGLLEQDTVLPHRDVLHAAGSCDVFTLRPDPRLEEFSERLFIDWGDAALAWIQRAHVRDKVVTEFRAKIAEPEFPEFPEFLDFSTSLSKLESLPAGWIGTLKASRGVYLLTCPKTGEFYVGKADGADGFWQRWQEYRRTGHGGNVRLRSRDPSDYRISILEQAGTAASAYDILRMEQRWKEKLRSREMGLNGN